MHHTLANFITNKFTNQYHFTYFYINNILTISYFNGNDTVPLTHPYKKIRFASYISGKLRYIIEFQYTNFKYTGKFKILEYVRYKFIDNKSCMDGMYMTFPQGKADYFLHSNYVNGKPHGIYIEVKNLELLIHIMSNGKSIGFKLIPITLEERIDYTYVIQLAPSQFPKYIEYCLKEKNITV